jgi:cell division protein FtsB
MTFWRTVILVVLACINLVLFGRMVWGPTGLLEYRELKQQYAAMDRQVADLDARNMALSREIRLLQADSQYVEKVIRQRLHYVRDNEVLYLFDGADWPEQESKP